MPVDYQQVDAIAAAVADIYAEAENALVAQMTRQLTAGGFDDATATGWQVRKLGEVRALRRTAQLLVDELQRDGNVAVRQAVADGWRSGNTSALTDLVEQHVGDVGPTARQVGNVADGRVVQVLADAVVEELRPAHAAVLRSVDDTYRRAVAGGVARKLAGARTLRQAAQDAWAGMARKGLTGFVDAGGRNWQLTTYAEMAVRTAVAHAAVAAEVDTITAAGLDACYVVDNPRECPVCRPYEGKVLALRAPAAPPAVATLDEAMQNGLFHPSCRHQVRSWQPGVRIVPARNPDPDGYDAEQRQRALERRLRRWRGSYAAAFDDLGRQSAARRIAAASQALAEHLDAFPRLPRKTYREHPGAGFRAPRSARTRRDAAHLASRA